MTAQQGLVVQAAVALERMAFVIAEPIDVEPEAELQRARHFAFVAIDGDSCGFLMVAATDGCVREIAAGMLGIEVADLVVDEHGEATVLELANVLGGHAIYSGGGDDSPLRLGLPEASTRERCAELLRHARADGFCGVVAAEHGRLVLAGVLPGVRC